jgi:lysozyme family protein
MSLFELSIPTVLRHEGGFNNVSGDPGGATNFGVSLRWLRAQGLLEELEHEEGDVTHDEIQAIKLMTVAEAEAFYQRFWWDAYKYGTIIPQAVATKIFDMSVNLGAPRAHRMVQKALQLDQDGILGPKSMAELNTMSSLTVIISLQNTQAQFYRDLVTANPARQKFLQGWLNRAYDRI